MVKYGGQFYNLLKENYEVIKKNFEIAYKKATGEFLSEDVFHDTLLKVAETITDNCMTNSELLDYTYIAFKNNMLRDKKYKCNQCCIQYDDNLDYGNFDTTEYWDVRNKIKDFIVKNYGIKSFEECCRWIIDRKSVREIEKEFKDSDLYYKFSKIKKAIIKYF